MHNVNAPIYLILNIEKAGCLHFLTSESQKKQHIYFKNWEELWKENELLTVKFLLHLTVISSTPVTLS